MKIGSNRREGIDWVHRKLAFLPRPLVEQSYFALLKRGFIHESEIGIRAERDFHPDDILRIGKEESVEQDNRLRRLMRRHITPRMKRMRLIKLNDLDMVDESGNEAGCTFGQDLHEMFEPPDEDEAN